MRATRFRPAALILGAIVALWAALPAAARPLTEDEATALDRSVARYLSAIGSKDAAGIVAAIPPRVLNIFAGTAGIEAKNLTSTLEKQTSELMKGSSFTDLTADLAALDATDSVLADGTPITWASVPTAFTAKTGDKTTRNTQPLLALSEGGKWYFMRIDGPQQKMIAALAYPFLADAKMPEATVTPLN